MTEPRITEIRSRTVPELLFKLHQQGATGRLVLRRMGIEKSLYLRTGGVVFAASSDRDDRLIQYLLRRGDVSLPHLLKGLETSLRTHRRLGEALVQEGSLTSEALVEAVRNQIIDIVCSAFQWTEGTLQFEEGIAPGPESITLSSHALELVLEGVRRIGSWGRVQEVVGGLNTEYRATTQANEVCERARLPTAERKIVEYCEETHTLEEICDQVPLNDFLICKSVWGLLVVGALMAA